MHLITCRKRDDQQLSREGIGGPSFAAWLNLQSTLSPTSCQCEGVAKRALIEYRTSCLDQSFARFLFVCCRALFVLVWWALPFSHVLVRTFAISARTSRTFQGPLLVIDLAASLRHPFFGDLATDFTSCPFLRSFVPSCVLAPSPLSLELRPFGFGASTDTPFTIGCLFGVASDRPTVHDVHERCPVGIDNTHITLIPDLVLSVSTVATRLSTTVEAAIITQVLDAKLHTFILADKPLHPITGKRQLEFHIEIMRLTSLEGHPEDADYAKSMPDARIGFVHCTGPVQTNGESYALERPCRAFTISAQDYVRDGPKTSLVQFQRNHSLDLLCRSWHPPECCFMRYSTGHPCRWCAYCRDRRHYGTGDIRGFGGAVTSVPVTPKKKCKFDTDLYDDEPIVASTSGSSSAQPPSAIPATTAGITLPIPGDASGGGGDADKHVLPSCIVPYSPCTTDDQQSQCLHSMIVSSSERTQSLITVLNNAWGLQSAHVLRALSSTLSADCTDFGGCSLGHALTLTHIATAVAYCMLRVFCVTREAQVTTDYDFDPRTSVTVHDLACVLAAHDARGIIKFKQSILFAVPSFRALRSVTLDEERPISSAHCDFLRAKAIIVLATATSAFAAQLYPGGRTAHSTFKIPVKANNEARSSSSSETFAKLALSSPGLPKRNYAASDSLRELDDLRPDIVAPQALLDFYSTRRMPGLPPHALSIKVGGIYRLLRNFSVDKGLVESASLPSSCCKLVPLTRRPTSITLSFASHSHSNSSPDTPSVRKQFPLAPLYATTFNSCQGLTVDRMGIDLTLPVFSHGQLHTALSPVRKRDDARILLSNNTTSTANVTFSELLS
ncbi:hypothetical protein NM688_g3598 [Phlebia brevispora]|uniref:Uncharacterized protein n=1 Tax=Phlebia brevispora TaxID=194682 RepID=A0ACC1T5F9_9APHY|nr:hypothetical protein NM688_g3598 [Phlebia brevispora]